MLAGDVDVRARAPDLHRLSPGDQFAGHRIVGLLGEGGMGTVYEAENLETGRRVALKLLSRPPDSVQARRRFLREGRLAAAVNHPNSVYVYGTEEVDATPVIIMELMPGGTLDHRVKRDGRLPLSEGVDAILQVIAGLEAAEAVGVLHRDVKPANCFVDLDGSVKVGDFGLSISTRAPTETRLTVPGAIMGTPAFSAPEQLRGDGFDVRSDIYAVGATLFYLLTGRTPFAGANFVKVMADVLERPPESPTNLRPEIPQQLAAIVLRCLAKQPSKRFQTYDALRRALLPFNSAAPTSATLGLRYLAGCIDHLILTLTIPFQGSIVAQLAAPRHPGFTQGELVRYLLTGYGVVLSLHLLYFAVPEGLWGASPGKAICRLRVINLARGRPGIPKAVLRCVSFWFVNALGFSFAGLLARPFFDALGHPFSGQLPSLRSLTFLGSLLFPLLLFVTARRPNGLSGLHDLLSKTRVILRSAHQAPVRVPAPVEPVLGLEGATKVGPYHIVGTQKTLDGLEVLLGYDSQLRRRVWIRKGEGEAPPLPQMVPSVCRPGRLRWLAGKRAGANWWDAYEALSGRPVLAFLERPQPWPVVRRWMRDLAQELHETLEDRSFPAVVGLDRVWITADGRAKLLGFPAPAVGTPSAGYQVPPLVIRSAECAQLFLKQVAVAMLEGSPVAVEDLKGRELTALVPMPAKAFVDRLPGFQSSEIMLGGLRSLLYGPGCVSRWRRLGLIAGCCLGPILPAAGVWVGLSDIRLAGRVAVSGLFAFVVIPSIVGALLFRGGLLLRVLRIEVVTRGCARASRTQLFHRSLVTWMPLLPIPVLVNIPELFWLLPWVLLLQGGGVVWAAVTPERGLNDRISRTWLVLR